MKTVRLVANILFYLSRLTAILFIIITCYALVVLILSGFSNSPWIPIKIDNGGFRIFYPFTKNTFLLGDYTAAYLVTNFFTIGFYGLFLWLLSKVFHAFMQPKLFTRSSVHHLSLFYIANLIVPFLFLILLVVWREEFSDIIRIVFLHLVIGVFAFFMAAIFKQGLLLQEEQDLTF
jgi:hypothetical protein